MRAKTVDLGIVVTRIDAFEQNVIWWWHRNGRIDVALLKRINDIRRV